MLFPLVAFVLANVPLQDFQDNAKNHWAFEGVAYMTSAGMLVGYDLEPLGTRHREHYRYDFAVVFNAGVCHLESLLQYRESVCRQIASRKSTMPLSPEQSDVLDTMRKWHTDPVVKRALDDMERAATEFASELLQLGVSPAEMRYSVQSSRRWISAFKAPVQGSALRRFSDVPANHWAAASVAQLRKDSILCGYPDAKYRG